MNLFGKNLISSQEWSIDELLDVLHLANKMKTDRFNPNWNNALDRKNFLMLFYNPSLRTHLSFETAVNELGGNPIYRTPDMGWSKSATGITSSESLQDMAKIISRYVDGVGIRITMDAISKYGQGHQFLLDFSKYSNIPIINMADDKFHPCQGLADIMRWAEHFSPKANINSLKGKTLLLTWGSSGFARPWASVQSHLLLASRFGMNIKLAYPVGYDLDEDICKLARLNCENNGALYEELHDPNVGYEKSDVVYVRNWVTKNAYQKGVFQYKNEIKNSLNFEEWIVTEKKMKRTQNAIFSNPMPIDRNKEAENAVIDSQYSVIYDVAENRKHVQKALLALTVGSIT